MNLNPSQKPRFIPRGCSFAAFTLIELLVVIAILGILAAIALPVFRSVTQSAHTTACISNLRQVASAMQLYSNDNNNNFLQVGTGSVNYVQALSPYVPSSLASSKKNIFVSPAAADPVAPYGNNTCITYALNDALCGNEAPTPLKMTDAVRPAELIMVANAAQIKAYNYNCAYTFWNPWQLSRGSGQYVTNLNTPIPVNDSNNVDDYPGMGYLRYVQKGNTAVNVAMVDGHAETIAKGKVLYRNVVYSP